MPGNEEALENTTAAPTDNINEHANTAETNSTPTVVVDDANIAELLHSKSFKERILAYQEIARFPQHISVLQNETMIPALEVALGALLAHDGPLKNADVSKLYLMAAQSKTSIRTKIDGLMDKVYASDREEFIESLLALLTNKNAKVVERVIAKITNFMTQGNGGEVPPVEHTIGKAAFTMVCKKLEVLMGSSDPSIKRATADLVVAVYRLIYDGVFKYIENVNPLALKDLKAEFEKYPAAKREVKLDTLSFDDPSWKERLNSMNALKNSAINPGSTEIIGILSRRLKDANLMVVSATVECVISGGVTNSEVIKGMLLRFKDKKAALSVLIKKAVSALSIDSGLLIDLLGNKNPEVKIGVLDCLIGYDGVERTKEIALLLDDGNAEVRSKAALILAKNDSKGLSSEQKSKVQRLARGVCADRIGPARPEGPVGDVGDAPVEGSKSACASPVLDSMVGPMAAPKISDECANGAHEGAACVPKGGAFSTAFVGVASVDEFMEAYPLFQEKAWGKKLEYLQESMPRIEKESIHVLADFMLSYKESNFNILRELIGILIRHRDVAEATAVLCSFLGSKAAEPKLREDVLALYRLLDRSQVVESILGNLTANSMGKRFIANLEILGQLIEEKDSRIDRYLERMRPMGIAEKAALESFKKGYSVLGLSGKCVDKNVCGGVNKCENVDMDRHTDERMDRHTDKANIKVSAEHPTETPSNCTDGMAKTARSIDVAMKCIKRPAKSAEDLGTVFTEEFLALMEKNPYEAVRLLEGTDQIAISGVLIKLYASFGLPSPYFNSLILYFISSKYILQEDEASALVRHLLGNAMGDELELVDRIYPATKLYGILRAHAATAPLEQPALCAIEKLVVKYTKTKVSLEPSRLAEAVGTSSDFLSLTTAIIELEKSQTEPKTGNGSDLSDYEDSFVIEDASVDDASQSASFLKAPSVLSAVEAAAIATACDDQAVEAADGCTARGNKPSGMADTSLIERSIENISISETPKKKRRDFNEIQDILNKLIHTDSAVSKEAFKRLNLLISTSINSLLFSSNSIIGSVIIQLFDKFSDAEFRALILHTLLKLSQNIRFCLSLRYETLRSINSDLVRIVADDVAAADILINLCLNCGIEILRVYLDLLTGNNEIVLKLIWRHSKKIDYAVSDDAALVLRIMDGFYQNKRQMLSKADNVVIKVCLLHLKDCCLFYSDGAKRLGVGEYTSRIIDLLLNGEQLDLDEVRAIFN